MDNLEANTEYFVQCQLSNTDSIEDKIKSIIVKIGDFDASDVIKKLIPSRDPNATSQCAEFTLKDTKQALFFFGFGIGHIYCKRYLNGFIQLFGELISFCLMGCLFWYFLLYDNHFNISFTLTNSFLKLYCPFAIVFVLSWQVIDTVLFFMGFYLDGNGIELF